MLNKMRIGELLREITSRKEFTYCISLFISLNVRNLIDLFIIPFDEEDFKVGHEALGCCKPQFTLQVIDELFCQIRNLLFKKSKTARIDHPIWTTKKFDLFKAITSLTFFD